MTAGHVGILAGPPAVYGSMPLMSSVRAQSGATGFRLLWDGQKDSVDRDHGEEQKKKYFAPEVLPYFSLAF
jgi:hypothetical protein